MAYECITRIIKNDSEIDRQTDSNDQTENDSEPSEPSYQAHRTTKVKSNEFTDLLHAKFTEALSRYYTIPSYPRPFTAIARK